MMPDKRLADLIDFYREAGVDALLGEEPVDRFAATDAPQPPPARGRSASEARRMGGPVRADAPTRPAPRADHPSLSGEGNNLIAPDEAAMAAREAARSAQNLAELRAIVERFDGCALKASATQLVFADGNPEARLMLVGEAPGRDEDIEGLPFIRRQIELADPDVLVCLGGPSSQTLLGQSGITKIRGRWFQFHTGRREIRAMPTFHPAFLLRSPLQKRFAWRDFLAIKKALDQR